MSFMTKLYLGVGGFILLAGLFFGLKWNYDNNKRMEGKLEILTVQLKARDSAMMKSVTSLGLRVDTAINKVQPALDRWHTTVIRDTIRLPGSSTPTFVFRDTAFRKLSDSAKVEVLISEGEKLAAGCSLLKTTCQIFKDSAFEAFRIKDSLIDVAKSRFNTKKQRHCSPGASVGAIGGLFKARPDSADKRAWRPSWGIGGALGMSCIL